MQTKSASATITANPARHLVLQHSSTSEDDDSTEPEEPLTPVTDKPTASHHFHHHDSALEHVTSVPHSIPSSPEVVRTAPKLSAHMSETQMSSVKESEANEGDDDTSYTRPQPRPTISMSPASPVKASRPTNDGNSAPAAATQASSSNDRSGSTGMLETQDLRRYSLQIDPTSPKKELPSMFDVPPGFRRRSPDRNRPIRRANTSDHRLSLVSNGTTSQSLLDAPPQGIQKAATDCWRPPTPPNHLLQKAAPESTKIRNPFSRSNSSFLGKLRRTTSSAKTLEPPLSITSNPRADQPLFDASKPISATNRRPSIPAPPRPSRSTPEASATHTPTAQTPIANTPPSPGSPISKTANPQEEEGIRRVRTSISQSNSRPTSSLNPAEPSRPYSIAWNTPSIEPSKRPSPENIRRRSQSTDHIPRLLRKPNDRLDSDMQSPQELLPTFSKHANEGAGLKARRLSTSLPNEFLVNSCELNDEYKSTKVFASRGKKLGKGATSEVTIMAVKGSKDELVAVKEFRGKDREEDASEYIQKVKSEYTIARSLHHPNIVATLRLCTHSGRWNHVMEYCEQGDVYHLVEKGLFKTHYKQLDRLCFFKQILRAVDYLHSHGIAHRDIKLENLLMTSGGILKLTDFGVSEVFCGDHPGLKASGGECGKNMGIVRTCAPGLCGSMPYIAPEVLTKEDEYDPRPLDVWSSAITYVTMQFGGPPWHSAKTDQPNYRRFIDGWERWLTEHPDGEIKNEEGGWPKCGSLFSNIDPPPLRRLLLKMLHPDPEKRISVREILTGSFLKGTECCSPESYEEPVDCGFDASKGMKGLSKANVLPKHNHVPPKEHRTPAMLRHRFDMGDGWNDGVKIRVV